MDKFENSLKCEIQTLSSLPVPHNSLEKVNSRPCAQFLFNFPQRFPFLRLSIVVFLFPSSFFFLHVLSFFFYSIFSIVVFILLKLFLLRFLFNSLSSPISTKFILLLLLLHLFVTNDHKKVLT